MWMYLITTKVYHKPWLLTFNDNCDNSLYFWLLFPPFSLPFSINLWVFMLFIFCHSSYPRFVTLHVAIPLIMAPCLSMFSFCHYCFVFHSFVSCLLTLFVIFFLLFLYVFFNSHNNYTSFYSAIFKSSYFCLFPNLPLIFNISVNVFIYLFHLKTLF